MSRLVSLAWVAAWVVSALVGAADPTAAADEKIAARTGVVRVADGTLQIGLDAATGSLREMVGLPEGFNQLADNAAPLGLWQIAVREGDSARTLSAEQAGPPKIEALPGAQPGWRLLWDKVAGGGKELLRVEVVVRLVTRQTSIDGLGATAGLPSSADTVGQANRGTRHVSSVRALAPSPEKAHALPAHPPGC